MNAGNEIRAIQRQLSDINRRLNSVRVAVAAGGEANTASNRGAGGIGIFDTKVGVDLQFRNINAASARISVDHDAGNKEVDIDAVEAQINHNALLNYNVDEHFTLPIAGTDVELEEIVVATYDDVQDWLNLTQSAGKTTTGIIITAHLPADGSVDIAAGTGFIKTTDSPIGLTKYFDWGVKNLVMADNKTNYIYIDYSAGAPEAKTTITRANIEMNRHFTLGRVYRSGNVVHIVNSGTDLTNTNARNHERLVGVRGFERDSGGVISEFGARFLKSTAGIFWLGANRIATVAQDTSGADRFTKWFPVAGVWNSTGGQQQVDNTQYSDRTNLQNLTPNKYGTMWCYIDYDSHLHVVYGLQNGTITAARAADPPEVPAFISDFAILAARLIIQQGDANIVEIEQAFVTFFPHTTPSEHVDLGGLQGGAAGEYYHLTAAEYVALGEVNFATVAVLGTL